MGRVGEGGGGRGEGEGRLALGHTACVVALASKNRRLTERPTAIAIDHEPIKHPASHFARGLDSPSQGRDRQENVWQGRSEGSTKLYQYTRYYTLPYVITFNKNITALCSLTALGHWHPAPPPYVAYLAARTDYCHSSKLPTASSRSGPGGRVMHAK